MQHRAASCNVTTSIALQRKRMVQLKDSRIISNKVIHNKNNRYIQYRGYIWAGKQEYFIEHHPGMHV